MAKPKPQIVDLEEDYPLFNNGTTKKTPISVEDYSEDRDLHIAIMASLSRNQETFIHDVQDNLSYDHRNDEDDLKVLNSQPQGTPFGKKRKKHFTLPSVTETGESSTSRIDLKFLCEICVESKLLNDSFSVKGCGHVYCHDCITKYVISKLEENVTSIHCPVPDCSGCLELEYCRSILPQHVFDRWGTALCEAVILKSEKFYCPFKDCSALLVDDNGKDELIKESMCPYCWRLFCAQCKVGWHAGIDCVEFQKLNKDEREKEDIMLRNLAKGNEWGRCPQCRFYVERTEGCMYIKCRCGTGFCYGCGRKIRTDHYCTNCRR